MFVGGYTVFTLSVRSSVMFCFLNIFKSHNSMELFPFVILNGFYMCKDSALMGRSTPTTAFDGAI